MRSREEVSCGKRHAESLIMPGYWDPCPGNMNAVAPFSSKSEKNTPSE